MAARPLFICLCLGLTLRGTAFAAKNVEVIQRPSLLMFGDVTQRVGVSYSFSDHASSRSEGSSTSHALAESYTLTTVAAIFDPEYAIVNLDLGGSYRQSWAVDSSSFFNAQYNVVTTVLRSSTNPITIANSRNTSLISNGFTPAYTLTRASDQFTVSLLHETLPVQFSYGHGSSQSKGLAEDYSSVNDQVSLSLSNDIPEVSQTTAVLSGSSEKSSGHDSRAYSLNLNNSLFLDPKKRYALHTSLNRNDSRALDVPQKTFTLGEALSAQFGEALKGNFGYEYSDSSTSDFQNQSQSTKSSTVIGSLSHRLYKSLITSISGTWGNTKAYGGSSTTYGGNASLAYFKLLPANSSLMLSGSGSRKITSQQLLTGQVTVAEEQHRVNQQGEFITPAVAGNLASVLSVKGFPSGPATPVVFVAGRDYRVDTVLDRIEILVGGDIQAGSDIFISYALDLNPDIKFQTSGYQAGYLVTLLEGRYTLGGGLSVMREKLLEGEQDNAPLSRSTTVTLRADRRVGATSMGADYLNSNNVSQKFSKLGAHYNYHKQFSRTDTFTLSLRDDYFMYPANGTRDAAYSENSLNLASSYGTRLFDAISATFVLGATDSRSRYGNGNVISSRVSLDADYRKLALSLNAMNIYRFSSGASTRDSNLTLSVTRSF